ncbi:MAG: PqqD family protein [Bacteroidaceae bacterium]|nr:PqqD family protein [Bacteroidaceae bacterium]
MKISSNYRLRTIAGETIVVNQGVGEKNLTRIISLNASARMMWEELADKAFTLDDAAHLLEETYGIDAAQARKDASAWVEALKKCGIIGE